MNNGEFFEKMLSEVYEVHKNIDDVYSNNEVKFWFGFKRESDYKNVVFCTKIICFTSSELIIDHHVNHTLLKINLEDIFKLKFSTKTNIFGTTYLVDSCGEIDIPYRNSHYTNHFRSFKTEKKSSTMDY